MNKPRRRFALKSAARKVATLSAASKEATKHVARSNANVQIRSVAKRENAVSAIPARRTGAARMGNAARKLAAPS